MRPLLKSKRKPLSWEPLVLQEQFRLGAIENVIRASRRIKEA